MYDRILVPVDGSAASALALTEAIRLARSLGSGLRLLHVVDEFVVDPGFGIETYYPQLVESLRAVGRRTLEDAVARVREHALEPTTILIETLGHRVARHIVEQAKIWPADLIVMGTHGRRGVARLVMGSDAELVLRSTAVPVMMLRVQAEAAESGNDQA